MLELRDATRRFGETTVLHGISLTVVDGSFTSLLGPSGCGKSTTLRIMAGLDRPTAGQVLIDDRDVAELTAAQRNVAMVFQSYALYPHLTVAQNIALPLVMRHMNRFERAPLFDRILPSARVKQAGHRAQVGAVAEMLGITELLDRKPAQLSGGQKQRVAVGRALVRDPSLFLLDEPLSNLDAKLRVQMRGELTALHRRTGRSFVYVTHDQAEAMSMSDRIAVFIDGRIAQAGSPRTLFERPVSRTVAAFIGSHPINLLDVGAARGELEDPFGGFRPVGGEVPARLTIGIRPEHLSVGETGPAFAGHVAAIEYLGAEMLVTVRFPGGAELRALAPGEGSLPAIGQPIGLDLDPARAHLFDPLSGERLDLGLERKP